MGSKSVESRSPLVWLGFLSSLVFSVYFTTFFDLLILTIYVPSLTSLPDLLPASPRGSSSVFKPFKNGSDWRGRDI